MGTARGITVQGQSAYIADEWYGVRVIDVANPRIPRAVGWYATPGYAISVRVAASYLYIADGWGGLSIRPATKISSVVQVQSSNTSTVVGQRVTFTATIAGSAPSSQLPSGNITFADGAQILGITSVTNGHATFSTFRWRTQIRAIFAPQVRVVQPLESLYSFTLTC